MTLPINDGHLFWAVGYMWSLSLACSVVKVNKGKMQIVEKKYEKCVHVDDFMICLYKLTCFPRCE